MHYSKNTSFSPPGNSQSEQLIPACAGLVPVVNLFYVAQFRRDFPLLAFRLDAMRAKASCASGSFSAMAATRPGGSEA